MDDRRLLGKTRDVSSSERPAPQVKRVGPLAVEERHVRQVARGGALGDGGRAAKCSREPTARTRPPLFATASLSLAKPKRHRNLTGQRQPIPGEYLILTARADWANHLPRAARR